MLTEEDHSRDSAGLTYVYPVISRRSGGLSVGINLNPNNACNWRCIYCQVPGLQYGAAPEINLIQLQDELDGLLNHVIHGDFYAQHDVQEGLREIKDIALSGNGEPTSAKGFDRIIGIIVQSICRFELEDTIKLVLITNGSLVQRKTVQAGLAKIGACNGEVWFKLDRASDVGLRDINHAGIGIERVKRNLHTTSALCPTWLQTCFFKLDGVLPRSAELDEYLRFLSWIKEEGLSINGVLLYGLARPSMQAEKARLSRVSLQWLQGLATQIRDLGLEVRCFP